MNYYDIPESDRDAKGLDYDLCACLEYNPQSFTAEDIAHVLAVWEGENDGDDWRWVIALNDGRFAFLQGGCDYTGWDCQSWATSVFDDTPEAAAKRALGDVSVEDSHPSDAGMGHMLNILSGNYMENAQEVYKSLMDQLSSEKVKTWRERMDKDMLNDSTPPAEGA